MYEHPPIGTFICYCGKTSEIVVCVCGRLKDRYDRCLDCYSDDHVAAKVKVAKVEVRGD